MGDFGYIELQSFRVGRGVRIIFVIVDGFGFEIFWGLVVVQDQLVEENIFVYGDLVMQN